MNADYDFEADLNDLFFSIILSIAVAILVGIEDRER